MKHLSLAGILMLAMLAGNAAKPEVDRQKK